VIEVVNGVMNTN